jgi:hypothetical protein
MIKVSGFVDQDAIHLIDDGVMQLPLHTVIQGKLHVVAEIIEAEFIVGAIDDVCLVSLLAGGIIHIVLNRPDRQSKHPVERPHPLRVTSGQVVIHGDDVDAPPVRAFK